MNVFPQQITWAGLCLFLAHGALFSKSPAQPPGPCPTPTNISLTAVSSISATVTWAAVAGAVYEWEVGLPGFMPGMGAFVFHDTASTGPALIFGLAASTAFEFHVRTKSCNDPSGAPSDWSPALGFLTAPGCGEDFFDPGGPLLNYPNNLMDTVLFCPTSDSEVVQINFLTIGLEENQDFLKIYDGTDASAPQLAAITGIYLPLLDTLPGPFTASNATGCLYTVFLSNPLNNFEGWTGYVSCVVPDSCFAVADIQVDSFGQHAAVVTWTAMFGAQHFEWKLGIDPYDPDTGIAVDSGTVATDTLLLDSLNSNTKYVLFVRSQCDSTAFSPWAGTHLLTPVACGDTLYDSGGPGGNYASNENDTLTICPDTLTHTVTLTFLSFITEHDKDTLAIYDGTDLSAPHVATYSGNPSPLPSITAHNSTGCLTLNFVSDGNNNTEAGWSAVVACDTAADCFSLLDLNLISVTKDSALITWTPIFGAQGYIWALDTTVFTPGVDTALRSGTVLTDSLFLDSLHHGTQYVLYVRSLCANDTSMWFGPLKFITPPGCGDAFYDTGGSNAPYSDSENITTVICPDSANQIVQLAFVNEIKTRAGDTLYIYNGAAADPFLKLDALSGQIQMPGTYLGTTANGCLTVVFQSDSSEMDDGWHAEISCLSNIDTCFQVAGLHLDSLYGATAVISWADMFGASGYEWRIGKAPYSYADTALFSGMLSVTSVTLDSSILAPLTPYDFWVRTLCSPDSAAWVKLSFATGLSCTLPGNVLACDQAAPVTTSGSGMWTLHCGGNGAATQGKEQIFQFQAPATTSYFLQVDTNTAGGMVDYFFKATAAGCNDTGWVCIGGLNLPGADTFNLVAGHSYYLLADPEDTAFVSQSFRINNCQVPNDTAKHAILIVVNQPCTGNVYSSANAGFDTLEPNPGVIGRWRNPVNLKMQTVWFKFVAPASGTVTISTDSDPKGGNPDTQMALYAAGDSTDYGTFHYIESDDDNGTFTGGANAVVYYTGLKPDSMYYVQVNGNDPAGQTFCIEVLDGVARYNFGDCDSGPYSVSHVDGTQPGGDHWYGIYAGQTTFDLGQLIAAVKPGPQILDTVTCHLEVYTDSIPVAPSGVPYMPAYFNFSSTKAPTQPVEIRLFFYNYELGALKLAAGLPSATADDLNVSQYTGSPIDCGPMNNAMADAHLIDTVGAVNTNGTASFYLQFTTKGNVLGEFGAHFGLIVLPIELKSFTGKVLNEANQLNWVTATEKNVAWHIVERSVDGVTWQEVGRIPGQAQSTIDHPYELMDQHPLPRAFYRLRSVDFDARQQVSSAIVLVRSNERLEVLRIFPSPVSNALTVQLATPVEDEVVAQLFDLNGRLVLRQRQSVVKGLNTIGLNLGTLPAGWYALSLTGSTSTTPALRVVKQ